VNLVGNRQDTVGDTVPLPKGVQCLQVQVQVPQNLPKGYPCLALCVSDSPCKQWPMAVGVVRGWRQKHVFLHAWQRTNFCIINFNCTSSTLFHKQGNICKRLLWATPHSANKKDPQVHQSQLLMSEHTTKSPDIVFFSTS
jgi:hypothetical protein